MKFKYRYIIFIAFGLFCSLGLARFGFMQNELHTNKLKLVVSSSKTTYLLGEVVPFSIELTNGSGGEVIIENTVDPVYGSLKFYVSNESKSINYEYMNPKWGIREVNSFVEMKENEKITNSKNVLSKLKSNTEVEYFFQKAGVYNLRVSYQIRYARETKPVLIESNPIQITIEEPVGEDLEVWNKIKDNGDIAYFLQEGEFNIPSYKMKEREKLRQEVEQLLIAHPNSFYAKPFKQSLEKFQVIEEKRKAYLEKIKQP